MSDLWDLTRGRPCIDPNALADAVRREAARPEPDHRTRLLIRDALDALRRHWGERRFSDWLDSSGDRHTLQAAQDADLGAPGFPTLESRLMEPTRPDAVNFFLRDLGSRLHSSARLAIGGSVALILQSGLARATEDIDVVDELPPEIRNEHALLDDLARRYGLRLTHFQSHFLPSGWESRLHSLGAFGRLQVFLVDPYDVCLSKLFSARDKDLDDLRVLLPRLDNTTLTHRLLATTSSHRADHALLGSAQRNWYILFGEALPA